MGSFDKKSTILDQLLNQTRYDLAGKYFAKQKFWGLFLEKALMARDVSPGKNAWLYNKLGRTELETLIDNGLFSGAVENSLFKEMYAMNSGGKKKKILFIINYFAYTVVTVDARVWCPLIECPLFGKFVKRLLLGNGR